MNELATGHAFVCKETPSQLSFLLTMKVQFDVVLRSGEHVLVAHLDPAVIRLIPEDRVCVRVCVCARASRAVARLVPRAGQRRAAVPPSCCFS